MASKLPHPSITSCSSSRAVAGAKLAMHASDSQLPLPQSRSWLLHNHHHHASPSSSSSATNTYPESVSSSASGSSSPEIAVADGAMLATPPKLELHELTHELSHDSDTHTATEPQTTTTMAATREVHTKLQLPRSSIPSLGAMKSLHMRARPARFEVRLRRTLTMLCVCTG